ncbi:protein kinase domain-containing protein [Streptomyces parvus]|uniref:PQQ-binding-like beta-propeller repeat protein n=1 Tax=Streptomyces parvus TaxID=66428 RepID=A0A7K3RTX4_9ACTN|nr:PQQ-binding-like beta-propeller repeat protein [Streptomyces parvus]NEC18671.1 PQQ-binding-like beta-propeller repeat protein [Streptomyces parvus]
MFSPLAHDDPHSLGPYRLIARLGGGGMGTVYLARSATGRTAALKTMHARIATDSASRTRFRLETDAARVIGPVHGARVFDADPHAETPWLATEYVLGPPLDDAVALTGPLPEPAVRALGTLLCAALAQLHASEVVHRDLKPSNIMVTADGPKVIDLGIARAIGDDRLTRTGTAAGTPAFMSPEQATGQEHTSAGDVFALAGVLTYAAAGHGPFGTGQHADLMYRVRHAEPDLTGVPAALVPVLIPCLSKNPAARPTTTELADRLNGGQRNFSAHLPEPLLLEIARRAGSVWHARTHRLPAPVDHALAETVPVGQPTPPSVLSRRKLLKFGGSSAFAAAAVGAGAWAWLGRREGSPPDGLGTTSPEKPAWDLVWQVETSYTDPRVPPAPLVLDGLLLVGEHGVQGLDPATGEAKWPDPEVYFMRRTATDGKKLYAADSTLDETGPLTVATVDPGTGKIDAPFGEIKDLRAALHATQLLCAAREAVFLAAGRGPDTDTGFHKDQTWFLLAVDTRTGKELWRVPLPARPHGSERLHFLSARAVGQYLVLVQQSADGEPRLAVHDAQTGKALWNRPLDGEQSPFSRAHLAVDDRYVYPSAGELVALGLADGREAWRFEGRAPGALFSPATVDDGVVYAVEEGRGMVALDAASGTERWAEKNRVVTAEDLDTPPVVGIAHVYSKGASGLMASDMRTGAVSRPFKAAKARYFAHVSAERLIAIGDEYTAAYPLA